MAIAPGSLGFQQLASSPPSPPVGFCIIYSKVDNILYLKDSSGTEVALGSASSITALTGEATATGPGSSIITLSNSAVIGKVLTGFSAGPNSTVVATDTIIQAIEKLQAQITASTGLAVTSLTGDVTGAGPGATATTVASIGGKTASQVSSSVDDTLSATSINTASTLVERDASGNFAASVITASLSGNASSATTATSFSGALLGDVTGGQSLTVVSSVGGKTASLVATSVDSTTAATASNTSSTLVKRDASGNFAANNITSSLTGVASGNELPVIATSSADYYRGDKTFQPLNKNAVGLSNVDNTSDSSKPVSVATQSALDLKESLSNKAVDLVSPDNTKYPTTLAVQNAIDSIPASGVISFNTRDGAVIPQPGDYSKADVGLGSVDNTSDANKPVSSAQAAAIAVVQSDVDAHELDTNNPHSTTAVQVGADPAGTATAAVVAHVALADPHPQYTTLTEAAAAAPVQSVNGLTGIVILVKSDVGLGNVDDTSDVTKPISTATQTALDLKESLSNKAVSLASPDNTKYPTTLAVQNAIDALPQGGVTSFNTRTGAIIPQSGDYTKSDVGLTNVDNTSDISKPVSTAQAAAIAVVQADIDTHEARTDNPHVTTKAQVGLSNVPNLDTSDPTNITQTSSFRFTTDAEKAVWNGKQDTLGFTPEDSADKGAANGYAPLDAGSLVPVSNLPSFVDDTIVNGVTTRAPSQNAVFDALAVKVTDPMTAVGDMIIRNGSNVTSRLPAGAEDFILRMDGGVPVWAPENIVQSFGGARDANITLTGPLVLTQMLYCNTLTLQAGASLQPSGYPVFCRTLDLSSAPVNAIVARGNNGTAATTQTGAGGGGQVFGNYLSGGATGGGSGSTGTTTTGTVPTTVAGANPANGGASGAGGQGGNGTPNVGAISRAAATPVNPIRFGYLTKNFLRGQSSMQSGCGGPGGSCGGGDGVNLGRGGGGGGSSGNNIAIYALEIITSGATPAGVITSIGGNGGNGASAAVGNVGGGGGGAGAGGAYIYVAYAKHTGPVVANLIQSIGGSGGNGGNGFGTGTGAQGGGGGAGGRIDVFNVSDGENTFSEPVAGATGTNGSGVTGGSGGAGGVSGVSI